MAGPMIGGHEVVRTHRSIISGVELDDGESWEGIAPEWFPPSSSHGGELPRLITEVLGKRAS
ncbi:hypothetical protein ED92_30565 [Amycolatopsis sp. MJM2582]|uniref:hypothetical protein n=1 Tax=Amycolatopsis sp. MJM2582 TaxID=1427749 RepID=UPI000506C078|nr:hypothetical protein [Amycolatopsis sp. MJM2582]KFZ78781.1 hypothetical protein ED92_30565 [Amycolatopsis sp. MJM2582]